MKLRGVKILSVLYLFAGIRHRADVNACLNSIISEFNACCDFDFAVSLVLRQIELSESGPISGEVGLQTQASLVRDILAEKFHIIVVGPPYQSFSRAPFSGRPGPKPPRDALWPKGLPHLKPAVLRKVRFENQMADFAVSIMKAASSVEVLSLLVAPEDLGPSRLGSPASLWQGSDVHELENAGMKRAALYQSDFCSDSSPLPTGILSNATTLLSDCDIHLGWPRFTNNGRYAGPLPPQRNRRQLI